DRGDLGAHEADHVVDRVARFHMATGRGDQHADRRVGLLGERDEPRAGDARHRVIDLAEHHHEARLEREPLGDRLDALGWLGLFLVGVHCLSWKGPEWYTAAAAAFRFRGLQNCIAARGWPLYFFQVMATKRFARESDLGLGGRDYARLRRLDTPQKIQAYLHGLKQNFELDGQ